MDVELPGLLANYELDENFVAVTRQAFLDANTGVDGATITVDQAALDTGARRPRWRWGSTPPSSPRRAPR